MAFRAVEPRGGVPGPAHPRCYVPPMLTPSRRRWFWAVVTGFGLLVAACGSTGSSASSSTTPADQGPPVLHPAAERRPVSDPVPPGDVRMHPTSAFATGVPVAKGNFADPFLLIVDDDEVYAYATNVTGANIPVLVSKSSTAAESLGDALPQLPKWTSPGTVWAPSVYPRGDGKYVLYYNSVFGITGHQCVGVAVGDNPAGPFVDDSEKPLVCPISLGGAIDPSMIVVDGDPWLIYKSDGNCCDLPTGIWSVRLSDDLLDTQGEPTQLITTDQAWEGSVVEAPELVEVGGQLHLFYSGNDWNTSDYAIGHASCTTVSGPCTKTSREPLLASGASVAGPGGETLVVSGDAAVIGYHGWTPGRVGAPGGERQLYAGVVTFSGDQVQLVPYG